MTAYASLMASLAYMWQVDRFRGKKSELKMLY